ncbi:MAG TPA: penicillin acylase family protein, partial [Thermoleophilaceae bacterium]|nr:penicillin acylase family protein [Thermoleophilaceae bacterium]
SEAFNSLGSDGPGKTEKVPRKGVKITRDKFNVPHVNAKTYDDGVWAAGWITAEDRQLLLEQARYNSRVAAVGVPNLDALDLIAGLKSFKPSAQTEAVVARQATVLAHAGKEGKQVLHDIDTYVSGINARYKKAGVTAAKWTRKDVFAFAALKGQFVGEGGGDEAMRTQFVSAVESKLGTSEGMKVFNDLRQHDDPEMPTSIDGHFPYETLPNASAGNVLIDADSYAPVSAVAGQAAAATHARPHLMSNELMIDAKHSATGHPLLVGGPQIGYYYPGLTYEIDMNAPGLHWRGASSAPFPGYMLIGRGTDFASTLTSAGGDIIDQYAETLCGGSDTKYVYKGKCRDMGFFDAGTLNGARVTFHTTAHGPVVGYATVKGRRVAISSKRSSYGKDALDLLLYRDLSTGKVHDPKSFFAAAAKSPQTFNSYYIDNKHIAEFTSGRLPIRPASVDPGLLTDGTGKYEWKGWLGAKAHPHGTNPKRGRIVNWNNNMAKGFGAADSEWMRAGTTGRVDLLNKNLDRLAVKGKWTLASVTSAMNAAATQDVRAIDTVPLLQQLLAGSAAPSQRAQQMLDLLAAWNKAGGSRLDRDGDGKIDDPGAAIMDAAWPKIADAFMAPVLGSDLETELARIEPRFDQPPAGQYGGWYQYFAKDIRRLLGQPETAPFNVRYCGGGNLTQCQSDVWAAIDAAGNALAQSQGSEDPTTWRSDANAERIKFVPGLLPYTMRYTNSDRDPTGHLVQRAPLGNRDGARAKARA